MANKGSKAKQRRRKRLRDQLGVTSDVTISQLEAIVENGRYQAKAMAKELIELTAAIPNTGACNSSNRVSQIQVRRPVCML
jgi:hypothetical protein